MSADPDPDAQTIVAGNGGQSNWKQMLLAMLLGALGGGAVPLTLPEVVRDDPYRGRDAELMRRELRHEQREAHLKLCARMPPKPTRQRIAKIEGWLSQRDPLFTPGSLAWSEHGCDDL